MEFKFINLEERREAEDIRRCLNNLYSTPAGSVVGDRDFGLSWAALDNVPVDAESTYALEVMQKTDRYEPRVKVTEVNFDEPGVATIILAPAAAGGNDIGK